jgi:GMP synthase-like glutamine amidotransferase
MVDRRLIEALAPSAVVMSGFASSFETYPPGAFMPVADWLLNGAPVPTLAVCGSHQLIGFIFGGGYREDTILRDEPMRPRRLGEPVTNPDYHPEYFMENGFYELRVLVPDPIFQHCGQPPMVRESHYCEVKHVPAGFNLLASTEECRIQALRHEDRPLMSVQFHPEDYTERFPDGKFILEAFFREAVQHGLYHRRGVH